MTSPEHTIRSSTATAILGGCMLLAWPATAPAQTHDSAPPTATLLATAPDLAPPSLFVLAMRLFSEGRRDEAVTWFYIAQIRGKFRFAVSPDLPPDGEPAAYEALFQTVGPIINGWAFGDVPALAAHMTEALDWDASHPNGLTPKAPNQAALEPVRSRLARFRDSLLAQREDIRRQRAAAGRENRT